MQIPQYWWTRSIEACSNSIATMNNCLYLCVAGAVVVIVNQCLLVLNVSVVVKWTEYSTKDTGE